MKNDLFEISRLCKYIFQEEYAEKCSIIWDKYETVNFIGREHIKGLLGKAAFCNFKVEAKELYSIAAIFQSVIKSHVQHVFCSF